MFNNNNDQLYLQRVAHDSNSTEKPVALHKITKTNSDNLQKYLQLEISITMDILILNLLILNEITIECD